jgi:hypothetical protein
VVLARRLLHPAAAPLAVLLFSVANGLVYYSSELKPYSGDVLATVTLLLVGDRLLASRGSLAGREWVVVIPVSVVVLFASYAALFVAAGVVLALVVDVLSRGDRKYLRNLAPLVATCVVAGVVSLFLVLRQTAGVFDGPSFLDPYWVSALGSSMASSLAYSPGSLATKLLAGVAAAGFVRIALMDHRRGLLLSLPFVLTLTAVFMSHYPLFARTLLFLVPIVVLCLAEGVVALALLFRGRTRAVVGVATGLLVAAVPVASGAEHLIRPRTHEEIKPALGFVAEHWRAGDTLYLHWGSQYAFRYYAECSCLDLDGGVALADMWPFAPRRSDSDFGEAIASPTSRLVVGNYEPDAARYLAQVRQLENRGRIWIIFSHAADEEESTFLKTALPRALGREGRMLLRLEASGAGAYLFDFGKRS